MENWKFSYKTGRSETRDLCSSSEHPLECMQGVLLPAHPFWEGTFTCLAACLPTANPTRTATELAMHTLPSCCILHSQTTGLWR